MIHKNSDNYNVKLLILDPKILLKFITINILLTRNNKLELIWKKYLKDLL